MNYLLPFVTFAVLIGAFYALIGKKRTPGQGVAFVLVFAAAMPLLDGGATLVREYGRSQEGSVAPGVVVRKLSSTGAEGSTTIGGSRRWRRERRRIPTVVTAEGFRYHDVIARILTTRSIDAWVIEYRTPCEASNGCYQRDFVSLALWSQLRVGQSVNVRSAKEQDDPGRLDENPMWGTALAKLGMGGLLVLVAGLFAGRLKLPRRRYVTAPAVVTAVEPLQAGGKVHWRVRFAHFSADGTNRESADEVFVAGIKPGDSCTAVYPPDQPDLGTLRPSGRVPA